MPNNIPTVSTYTRVLGTIAQLMPELADGMGSLNNRKPIHEQHAHVLQMDQKMRQTVRDMPRYLLQQDLILEVQLPWLGIARQSLAITAAEKVCQILLHLFRLTETDYNDPPSFYFQILSVHSLRSYTSYMCFRRHDDSERT